jgi:hypothetical protein
MNNLAKIFSILLILPAFLVSFTNNKKADRANFSGNWSLNESKSEMGQFANIVPRKIKVEQKADSIAISKTSTGFDGNEFTVTETLSFDGKETKSTTPPGSSVRKASAKWSDDGQTLTITYNLMLDFNGQQTEIRGTEIWTSGDGGKTLSTQNSSSSSFGENTYKGIYEK